jgi:hypothetical protein
MAFIFVKLRPDNESKCNRFQEIFVTGYTERGRSISQRILDRIN